MSKVAIQGNASGTGTFTIAAPNSNTDRTLTLPDEAGTVLTSGGAIDVDASAPADSVVIDSSGNLGVGTTSDGSIGHFKNATGNATLKVEGGTTAGNDAYANIEIGNTTGTSGIFFSDTTNGVGRITYEHNGDYMRMYTGSTERMRIDSTGNLQFNSGYGSPATAYGCRAWVNFNGTGTVAIRASGNVSSITDNGTGNYNMNFTTAMPDSSYCVNATVSGDGDGNNRSTGTDRTANSTSYVRVYSFQTINQTATDDNVFCVAVIR